MLFPPLALLAVLVGLARGSRAGGSGPPAGGSRLGRLRALRLLRDEGLVEFRRGRGVTVVGPARRSAVLARARELVQFARHHGYGRDELIRMIEDIASAAGPLA